MEIIDPLVLSVCPLLYALEICPVKVSDVDFVINRFFMMLFNTNVMDTVRLCQDQFGFELPSVLIAKRKAKFVDKFEQFTRNCFAVDYLCMFHVS